MEPNTYIIDLEDYRTPGAKVFTTRPRGISVRNASKIDSIEPKHDKIVIRIPEDISSINPSFLEEFFENVVLRLKEKGFYEKFKFENPGRYKITVDLAEAVERILRDESALAK
jgi:hypothetical protein